MSFYEALRLVLSKSEFGIHHVGNPATEKERSALKQRLGHSLPMPYEDFLSSFDGASLFHETVLFFSSKDPSLSTVFDRFLRIGEIAQGSLCMDAEGIVYLVDESTPDPMVIGSNLDLLLESILARESLLIDRHGEFLEVFDDEGEITFEIKQKQAKAGHKKDPKSAFYLYELAEISLMEEKNEAAISFLSRAITCDPKAGPCYELLASLHRDQGESALAKRYYEAAAYAAIDLTTKASRFLQAALLSTDADRKNNLTMAWQTNPNYAAALLDQAMSFLNENPEEAKKRSEQIHALIEAIDPKDTTHSKLLESLAALDKQLRARSRLSLISPPVLKSLV